MKQKANFHLTFDNVLVKWVDPEKVTKGGIVLPNAQSQSRPLRGTVLAIGPAVAEKMNMRPELEVGDIILFEKFAGSPVTLGDKEYLLMSALDIILVFEKES